MSKMSEKKFSAIEFHDIGDNRKNKRVSARVADPFGNLHKHEYRQRLRDAAGQPRTFLHRSSNEMILRRQAPGSEKLVELSHAPDLFSRDFAEIEIAQNQVDDYLHQVRSGKSRIPRAGFGDDPKIKNLKDAHRLGIKNKVYGNVKNTLLAQQIKLNYKLDRVTIDPNIATGKNAEYWQVAASHYKPKEANNVFVPGQISLYEIYGISRGGQIVRDGKPIGFTSEAITRARNMLGELYNKELNEMEEKARKNPAYAKTLVSLTGGYDDYLGRKNLSFTELTKKLWDENFGSTAVDVSVLADLARQGMSEEELQTFNTNYRDWQESLLSGGDRGAFMAGAMRGVMDELEDVVFAEEFGIDSQNVTGADGLLSLYAKEENPVARWLYGEAYLMTSGIENLGMLITQGFDTIGAIASPVTRWFSGGGSMRDQVNQAKTVGLIVDIILSAIPPYGGGKVALSSGTKAQKMWEHVRDTPLGEPLRLNKKGLKRKDAAPIVSRAFQQFKPNMPRHEADNQAYALATRVMKRDDPIKWLGDRLYDVNAVKAVRTFFQKMPDAQRAQMAKSFQKTIHDMRRGFLNIEEHINNDYETLLKSQRMTENLLEAEDLAASGRAAKAAVASRASGDRIRRTKNIEKEMLDARKRIHSHLAKMIHVRKSEIGSELSYVDGFAIWMADTWKRDLVKRLHRVETLSDIADLEKKTTKAFSDADVAAIARLLGITSILSKDGRTLANMPNVYPLFKFELQKKVKAHMATATGVVPVDDLAGIAWAKVFNLRKDGAKGGYDMNKVNHFIAHKYDRNATINESLDEMIVLDNLFSLMRHSQHRWQQQNRIAEQFKGLRQLQKDLKEIIETETPKFKELVSITKTLDKEAEAASAKLTAAATQRRLLEQQSQQIAGIERNIETGFIQAVTRGYSSQMKTEMLNRLRLFISDVEKGIIEPKKAAEILDAVLRQDTAQGILTAMRKNEPSSSRLFVEGVVAGHFFFSDIPATRHISQVFLDPGAGKGVEGLRQAIKDVGNMYIEVGELFRNRVQRTSVGATGKTEGATAAFFERRNENLKIANRRMKDFVGRHMKLNAILDAADLPDNFKLKFRAKHEKKIVAATSLATYDAIFRTIDAILDDTPANEERRIRILEQEIRTRYIQDIEDMKLEIELEKIHASEE